MCFSYIKICSLADESGGPAREHSVERLIEKREKTALVSAVGSVFYGLGA